MIRNKLPIYLLMLICINSNAQNSTEIPVPKNLTAESIPSIPLSLVQELKTYSEARSASLLSLNPVNYTMLISTRFGNTNQVHEVKQAMGSRKQITFFEEAVRDANYEPVKGNYFLFTKDIGGNEFSQIYRYDLSTHKSTLLTEGGRSQNGNIRWSKSGKEILYTATSGNSANRNVYRMNPLDASSSKKVMENEGGGWSVADWNEKDETILMGQSTSVNETAIWIGDLKDGSKNKILPANNEKAVFNGVAFNQKEQSIYLITNLNSEYLYPASYNLKTKKFTRIGTSVNWDISSFEINDDQNKAALVYNEAGISKLYISDLKSSAQPIAAIPTGIIGRVLWRKNNTELAMTLGTSQSGNDVFVLNVLNNKLSRWTESELGDMDLSGLTAPKLINWKSFDNLNITGFIYKANQKFTGKRPVIINIHGGPEGQSLPVFIGRNNYYLNELGVTMIFPNVRGSVGYGKTFTDLDNGLLRKNSVKDIGALIDWIKSQPDLDANRIMITGGSYGGYMTLACAVDYSDRIRCALDVVGISNFKTFLQNTETYRRDLRRVEYGDERDSTIARFFDEISPTQHVDKITVPMFIVQGKNDPRVPYTESRQMVDKIRENGKSPVWFLMADDEGHGFAKKNNQDFQFYATVLFVKKYLLD